VCTAPLLDGERAIGPQPMKELRITDLPLNGYVLIEASAGTGKTFTISNIFLRLILEEGFSPEQILVVTFTRAATEELKTKLRQRLADAVGLLKGQQSSDSVLKEIVAHALVKCGEKEILRKRLDSAIMSMDQAAVFTIHGFCLRMLKEFAFDACVSASQLNIRDPGDFVLEAVQEFLRTKTKGHKLYHEFLVELFPGDPSINIAEEVFPFIRIPEPLFIHRISFSALKEEFLTFQSKTEGLIRLADSAAADMKRILVSQAEALLSCLENDFEKDTLKKLKSAIKRKITYRCKACVKLVNRLTESFLPDAPVFNEIAREPICNKENILSYEELNHILKQLIPVNGDRSDIKSPSLRKVFDDELIRFFWREIEAWRQRQPESFAGETRGLDVFRQTFCNIFAHRGIRDRAKAAIVLEALEFVREYLSESKRLHGWSSYDSMLVTLLEALRGKGGQGLARRISFRYPVALIDEFQDTDSIQWGIFRAIYSDSKQSRLFLIGDPKQAIYGFRGADIFTYLKAKKTVEPSRRFSLGVNWRSAPAIVNAINRIFLRAGKRAFVLDGIEYSKVEAKKENDWHLEFDEFFHKKGPMSRVFRSAPVELWLCFDDENIYEKNGEAIIGSTPAIGSVEATAKCIKQLIELGSYGRLFLKDRNNFKRPVVPGDITILVETHLQARQMKKALFEQGVAAVYYGPGSIFSTNEARELLYILRGVLNPSDIQAVFTALGTTCLGYDALSLFHLKDQFEEWDSIVDIFSRLKALWQSQGVFAMLRSLFVDFKVPKRLLALKDGARRLTNLRQCSELLAAAETQYPGPERLCLWLREAIEKPDNNSEEQQLRLETDENLVTIMTYHRSKGLEFPILFLPFIGQLGLDLSKGIKKSKGRYYSQEHQSYVIRMCEPYRNVSWTEMACDTVVTDSDPIWHTELKRQLEAEYVRLIYVALTRAKYKIYMAFDDKVQLLNSTFGRLLFPQEEGRRSGGRSCPRQKGGLEQQGLQGDIQSFPIEDRLIHEVFAGANVTVVKRNQLEKALDFSSELASAKEEKRVFCLEPLGEGPLVRQQWSRASFSSLVQENAPFISLLKRPRQELETLHRQDVFGFPRGPVAGNCVHRFFEIASFGADKPALLKAARVAVEESGLEDTWIEVLCSMAERVFSCQLVPGLRLRDLPPEWHVKEMEFYIPFPKGFVKRFSGLDEYCSKGVVKGIVDLVFRYDGRFYVLDYKTNWLGDTKDDYCRQEMEKAMDEHNYWLQAAIYAKAVHCHLSSCLNGYSFHRDFAGAFYLFVRGIDEEGDTGSFNERPGVLFINKDRILRDFDWLFNEIKGSRCKG